MFLLHELSCKNIIGESAIGVYACYYFSKYYVAVSTSKRVLCLLYCRCYRLLCSKYYAGFIFGFHDLVTYFLHSFSIATMGLGTIFKEVKKVGSLA